MPTIYKLLLLFVFGSLMAGCSKKDKDYEQYITGGEIVYPGIVSNASYRAGDRRVQLKWNPSPDPFITKYMIYWNNRKDSVLVNATTHKPGDTVSVLISGLNEYVYNFTVYSLDEKGNVSIPLQVNNIKVYGPVYQGGLLNRPYNAVTPYVVNANGSVQLNFNTPDTINIATQIRYTSTAGQVKDIILPPGDNSIMIADFKFGTTVQYRSSYIPVSSALDTFYTAFGDFPAIKRFEDVTTQYIQNPGNPFVRGDNGTGKWGVLQNWLYNTNLLNQNSNTAGGWSWDGNPSGVIHFESQDWSGPGITNGKLYQTFTLPAGEYKASFYSDGGGSGSFINGNFVVAAGNTLPDIGQLSGALGQVHWDQNNISGPHEMSFILSTATTVAMGWVVSTGTTSWNHINSITLKRLQ